MWSAFILLSPMGPIGTAAAGPGPRHRVHTHPLSNPAPSDGAKPVRAVPASRYTLGPPGAAHDGGVPIDVHRENRAVSRAILRRVREDPTRPLIIVPGFTPPGSPIPQRLHPVARSRAVFAALAWRELDAVGILVTGGNVHPGDTPYNEALELKRYLQKTLKVRESAIAIEPFARHSTTNLRNAGRFMLTHGVHKGLVVTDTFQSFYYSATGYSGFNDRCLNELGYVVGELSAKTPNTTRFLPSPDVMRRGSDPLDP